MKNRFIEKLSSKDKSKKLKCRLLHFVFESNSGCALLALSSWLELSTMSQKRVCSWKILCETELLIFNACTCSNINDT